MQRKVPHLRLSWLFLCGTQTNDFCSWQSAAIQSNSKVSFSYDNIAFSCKHGKEEEKKCFYMLHIEAKQATVMDHVRERKK